MENAGAGAAAVAREMLAGRRRTVFCACGPGGNGGDAMVVARHLAIDGLRVRILLLDAPRSDDARLQLAICRAMALDVQRLPRGGSGLPLRTRGAGLLVDGIFGTGLTRAPEGVAEQAILAINRACVPVLALDLPSGLDCDSGEPLGACVRADVTATFVAPKVGFSNPRSLAYTGDVRVVGIGAPSRWPRRR